ncbi:MAG: hypothetical protein V7L29_20960 [Nostoc sp.]|uniref:hypothetical protein n=1 Tax=Nostoc sp. TaxID=1180 RepID=UPI002FF01E5D
MVIWTEGERNPLTLAALKDGRIKASIEDIAAALTGDYRRELIFMYRSILLMNRVTIEENRAAN